MFTFATSGRACANVCCCSRDEPMVCPSKVWSKAPPVPGFPDALRIAPVIQLPGIAVACPWMPGQVFLGLRSSSSKSYLGPHGQADGMPGNSMTWAIAEVSGNPRYRGSPRAFRCGAYHRLMSGVVNGRGRGCGGGEQGGYVPSFSLSRHGYYYFGGKKVWLTEACITGSCSMSRRSSAIFTLLWIRLSMI